MEPRSLPSPGSIFFLEEVIDLVENRSAHELERSVRIIGRLTSHDVQNCKAVLEDGGVEVSVDTRLIEPLEAVIGTVMQIIGEVQFGELEGEINMKARTVRCCSGMDMTAFKKAVEIQRKYLESRT